MRRDFIAIAGWGLMIAILLGIIAGVINDVNHPELWDGDWIDDPRRYWPYLTVVSGFLAAVAVYVWWECRNDR